MAKKTDPLYVTWFKRNSKGRLEEVDIFGFIASKMNRTAYEWNTQGLGSIIFKKGTLKIIPLTDKTGGKGNNYEAMWFELDLKVLKAAPGDLAAALQVLYKIVNDKSELLKLEKKAYLEMVRLLTIYLGKLNALVMHSEYQAKPYSESGKKSKLPLKFSKSGGEYSSKWNQLINDVILKKDPKVVGGAVVSFSLADLLQVQIPSPHSNLRSIFMMEEFGTGLYADPELRRPYLGSSTPYKVPQQIANQFGMPSAIFMWWPFPYLVKKAWLMYISKLKNKTQSAWIQKLKNTHGIKGSLNDYRKNVFADIQKYKAEGSLKSPLAWAYGAKREGKVGHPGRKAQHLFFNRNGIVDEIRLIQVAGYRRLLQLIDEEIKSKVPGFNVSIADKVFGGLNY